MALPNLTRADLAKLTERELTELLYLLTPGREPFDPRKLCYPEQLAYVESSAKRKVLRKTRRAGGTVALAVSFLKAAIAPPFANQLYVTSTLKNAKRLIWPTLKKLNTQFNLGGQVNEVEAFMRFPKVQNEPIIYLGGAKDSGEIEKIRGYEGGLKRAAIDEVQSLRQSIVATLVDDVIEPSLFDYDGELDMVGTPGPICAGYFYDVDVGAGKAGWDHFFLDMRRNPFLAQKSGKPPTQILAELRERRKWTEQNATYRREYCGEWITDSDALALHYDAARNACEWQESPVEGWRYMLVFDIGFDDADAIAVLGWAPHTRQLRLVKEKITRKQGITPLGNQLKELFEIFKPAQVIGDLGALGKKIGEELKARWSLPIVAADKARKAEHIGLLDDALRTGAFLAPPDSVFAEDCAIVQWDAEKRSKGVLEFDHAYHSDICFVADTLITTDRGPRRIQDMRVGDLVLTRRGFRPVSRACWTGNVPTEIARFSDGRSLRGTPDHPIITGGGYVQLHSLTDVELYVTHEQWDASGRSASSRFSSSRVACAAPITRSSARGESLRSYFAAVTGGRQKPSSGAGRFGVAGQDRQARAIAATISTLASTFIAPNGSPFTARFPPGITSTTLTRIGTTIDRRTSPRSQEMNMWRDIRRGTGALSLPLRALERRLGTRQTPDARGTANMREKAASPGGTRKPFWSPAKSAASSSPPKIRTERFAAVRVTPAGIAPVFELSVEDEHEYFANGILVKNCDAVLYGYRMAYHWAENTHVPEPTVFDDPLLRAMVGPDVGDDAPNYSD